jgi:alpha-tubulin suppressor-like RCC1 family protein
MGVACALAFFGVTAVATPALADGDSIAIPSFSAVASGNAHTLALSTHGHVFAWGANDRGQGGLGAESTGPVATPQRVVFPVDAAAVVAIGAGGAYSLALDQAGVLWSWGDNACGVLGTASPDPFVPAPMRVQFPESRSVVSFSAGISHALAVTDDGAAYAWGCGAGYVLGQHTSTADRSTPTPVVASIGHVPTYLTGVASVSAGADHSLALMASGALLGWGKADRGQLGAAGQYSSVPAPVWCTSGACADLGRIAKAVAGDGATFVVWGEGANVGRVSVLGANSEGLAGTGSTQEWDTAHAFVATDSGPLMGVVDFATRGTTAAALTASGNLYTWGGNAWGQLADGQASSLGRALAARAPLTSPGGTAAIAVGAGSVFAISNDGASPVCLNAAAGVCETWSKTAAGGLYGIGANASGQLGGLGAPSVATAGFVNVTFEPGAVELTSNASEGSELMPGTVLTATPRGWPQDVAFAYAWTFEGSGAPVTGEPADQPTYTVAEGDAGQTIAVTATPLNVAPGDVNWMAGSLSASVGAADAVAPAVPAIELAFPAEPVHVEPTGPVAIAGSVGGTGTQVAVRVLDQDRNAVPSDLAWNWEASAIEGTAPADPGSYTIVVEATGDSGDPYGRLGSGRAEIGLAVDPPTGPPAPLPTEGIAILTDPAEPRAGDEVRFAVWETDPQGNPVVQLPWNMIGCVPQDSAATCVLDDDGQFVFSSTLAGEHTVVVTVDDGQGNQYFAAVTLTVAPGDPVIAEGALTIATEGTMTQLVLGESTRLQALGHDVYGNAIDLTPFTRFTSSAPADTIAGAVLTVHRIGAREVSGAYFVDGRPAMSSASNPLRVVVFTDAPIAVQAPSVSPASPRFGDVLTVTAGTWRPAAVQVSYQWQRNGRPIAGATGPTYAAQESDIGAHLTAVVRATSLETRGEGWIATAPTEPVGLGAPVSFAPVVAGVAQVRQTLTAVTDLPAGWAVASYQWLRAGAAIPGATAQTYEAAPADAELWVSVRVVARRTNCDDAVAVSSPVLVGLGRVPTFSLRLGSGTAPAISGEPTVGKTLNVIGVPAVGYEVGFQWLRGDKAISKATASHYKLTAADAGASISVSVTVASAGHLPSTQTAAPVKVAKIAPKVTVKLSKSAIARGVKTKATITVKAPGVARATGTVKVTYAPGKTLTKRLTAKHKGRIAFTIPAQAKAGKYKIKVTYQGTGAIAKRAAKTQVLRVR